MSGHLLLGLSRIYAKKVAYLAADASEVITKLKVSAWCGSGAACLAQAGLKSLGGAATVRVELFPLDDA